jgi:hypothetical protein
LKNLRKIGGKRMRKARVKIETRLASDKIKISRNTLTFQKDSLGAKNVSVL